MLELIRQRRRRARVERELGFRLSELRDLANLLNRIEEERVSAELQQQQERHRGAIRQHHQHYRLPAAAPPTTSSSKVPPPASSLAIMSLPKRSIRSEKDKEFFAEQTCGVCLDNLTPDEEEEEQQEHIVTTTRVVTVSRMPCGHVFHAKCLIPWLQRTCTCPECRYEIATNDREYERSRKQRMKKRKTVPCHCDRNTSNHSCFFGVDEKDSKRKKTSSRRKKKRRPSSRPRMSRKQIDALKAAFLEGHYSNDNSEGNHMDNNNCCSCHANDMDWQDFDLDLIKQEETSNVCRVRV